MLHRLPAIIALAVAIILPFSAAKSQDDAPDGGLLFARYCASCHGPRGEGNGPVAGAILLTVPNLRTLTARSSSGQFPRDAVMRYIDGRDLPEAHGDRQMPVWGETFSADAGDESEASDLASARITAITDFIERLQSQ